MSLKSSVYREVSSKLLDYLYDDHISRIMVLDEYTTKIISKVFKMHDIFDKGVTLVDDLNKKREPVPLEAIYLITPTIEKIRLLINDFLESPTYIGAHVFFIDECSDDNLNLLGRSVAANYILTLREIQLNFLVNESQLFSFDLHSKHEIAVDDTKLQEYARGVVGICEILNENPVIYCQSNERSQRFSNIVFKELIKKANENPSLGQSAHKDKSVLLILDRSIDPLTPLLHDLHLQCLAYDVLEIDNDIYNYKKQDTEKMFSVDLTEDDALWAELRHLHIADVSRILPCKLNQLAVAQRCIDDSSSPLETINNTESLPNKEYVTKQLAYMVKKMPHLRQEAASVSNLFHLSEACLRAFKNGVNDLCDVEQCLVMGTDASGNTVKNPIESVLTTLSKDNITMSEKIRVLLTLIISQGGMSENAILDLVQKLHIDSQIKNMYYGLGRFDKFIFYNDKAVSKSQLANYPYLHVNRKHTVDSSAYTLSRWTPFLKDILEDIICGQPNTNVVSKYQQRALSVNSVSLEPDNFVIPERPSWIKSVEQDVHSGPRLIVFILGGVTLAESRVACDVTKLCQSLRTGHFKTTKNILADHGGGRGWNWEVIVGGTEVLVPETYLQSLGNAI